MGIRFFFFTQSIQKGKWLRYLLFRSNAVKWWKEKKDWNEGRKGKMHPILCQWILSQLSICEKLERRRGEPLWSDNFLCETSTRWRSNTLLWFFPYNKWKQKRQHPQSPLRYKPEDQKVMEQDSPMTDHQKWPRICITEGTDLVRNNGECNNKHTDTHARARTHAERHATDAKPEYSSLATSHTDQHPPLHPQTCGGDGRWGVREGWGVGGWVREKERERWRIKDRNVCSCLD